MQMVYTILPQVITAIEIMLVQISVASTSMLHLVNSDLSFRDVMLDVMLKHCNYSATIELLVLHPENPKYCIS